MNKNTLIANTTTILGVAGMLAIAGFSLPVSAAILATTTAGCISLTKREGVSK